MNAVDARARLTPIGYIGEFRKVHRAEWEPVCLNGIVITYLTAELAEIAAWRALRSHLCGEIVGTGEKASIAKAEVEFAKVFPGKGRKPFVVERR